MGILSRLLTGPPTSGHGLTARADRVTIESPEPTWTILRPGGATYDVEREYDEYGAEQRVIWQADGVKASRPSVVHAEAASPQSATVRDLMDPAWDRVRATGEAFEKMRNHLLPFAPRRAFETQRYVITWIALVLGDIAGIFGAALTYGEVPGNALGQAIACGVAAVTGGLVGADVKNAHIGKAISGSGAADSDKAEFGLVGIVFTDSETYGPVLRIAAALAAALFLGIFALRMSIEGVTGGLVFGGLSCAIAAASFINAWVHANPAADLLAAYEHAHELANARYLALGAHPSLAAEAAEQAEASSIEAEHDVRGRAAQHHVEALKWGILRRHPQIFGHGTAELTTPTNLPTRVVPMDTRTLARQTDSGGDHP